MILASVSMVRNESDIIEAFVRHNLRFIDRLFILNHASSDSTGDILARLQQEHLPVQVFDDSEPGFRQGDRTSELSRFVCTHFQPDFIFLLDADEFLAAPSRRDLEQQLLALPPNTHGLIPWRTWVPTRADDSRERNPLKRIRYRRNEEGDLFCKTVLASNYWQADISQRVGNGNHSVNSQRDATHQPLGDGVFLGHFPVRSRSQLIAKVLVHWHARLAEPDFDPNSGNSFQHRDIFRLLVHDGLAVNEDLDLETFGREYSVRPHLASGIKLVYDPFPCDFSIRYEVAVDDPLILLARATEELVLSLRNELQCYNEVREELARTRLTLKHVLASRSWRYTGWLRKGRHSWQKLSEQVRTGQSDVSA